MPTNLATTTLFCLDPAYSTTRLVTLETPIVENLPVAKFETMLFLPEVEGRKVEGGLRTQGHFKKSLLDKPLITIITVVFNDKKHLEDTILSVINQTYDNVEYIVIDGGSIDGTVDIIKKYENQIDYWVSEKDEGIYYAMNKGISSATGSWINFMNSGDKFTSSTVLKEIVCQIFPQDDVIFGSYLVSYPSGVQRKGVPLGLRLMWRGPVTSHQATFIRTELIKDDPFNLGLCLAADHEMLSRLLRNRHQFHFVSDVVATVSAAGASDNNRIHVLREFSLVAALHFSPKPFRLYFWCKQLDSKIRTIVKKVLPVQFVKYLQKR